MRSTPGRGRMPTSTGRCSSTQHVPRHADRPLDPRAESPGLGARSPGLGLLPRIRRACLQCDDRRAPHGRDQLAGCVLFMIAAVASFVLPSTGSVLALAPVNWGTALGALCFFIGAVLL